MSLFLKLSSPDRQKTQLAYRVKYWPINELSEAAKCLCHTNIRVVMTKAAITISLSESASAIYHHARWYSIVWVHNNMPTEMEWNKVPDNQLLYVNFRESPAIDSYRVAIMSFELPKDKCVVEKQKMSAVF
jgi:hypothetical protein